MGSLDLPVQSGCAGSDLDAADARVEQMPAEAPPELLPVIGLDLLNLEREFREHVIDALHVDLQGVSGARLLGALPARPGSFVARARREVGSGLPM